MKMLTVHPRADKFFKEAGYVDGAEIEREVYFALLLDGSLSTPECERRTQNVKIIPLDLRYKARRCTDSEAIREFMRDPQVVACRHLLDYYQVLRKLRPVTSDPSLAAYVCLVRHVQQAEFKRKQQLQVGGFTQPCPHCQASVRSSRLDGHVRLRCPKAPGEVIAARRARG